MARRVVLDTSVLVAGLRARLGASNAVLRLVASKKLTILATPPLFLEYEDVLKRAEQRLGHGLTIDQIDGLLAELAAIIEPIDVRFLWRPQTRDPADEMVLEAAINGRADILITHNIGDFIDPCKNFDIEVLRPSEILKRIRHE